MTLQQQVQQHLQNTGISLRELSRRSGISHQAIGNILRDTYLECAKYRRVMQLEQQLNDANTAYLSSKSQHERDLQRLNDAQDKLEYMKLLAGEDGRKLQDYQAQISKQDAWIEQEDGARNILQSNLNDANTEIKRLTALSETHAASWKAACVQAEHLQKQLDHANSEIVRMDAQLDQALEASQKNAASAFESALNRDALQSRFDSLQVAYNQQVDDEREMLAQIDTLFVERENAATLHDQLVMRLRVYVWSLIAALVFVLVSSLVVWGGV